MPLRVLNVELPTRKLAIEQENDHFPRAVEVEFADEPSAVSLFHSIGDLFLFLFEWLREDCHRGVLLAG